MGIDDEYREYLPWIGKPRVTLEQFMKDAPRAERLFYGDIIHITSSGHRVVEIQSGKWDGHFLIIPLTLWAMIKNRGGITEE